MWFVDGGGRRMLGGCWESRADGGRRLVTGDLLQDAQCRLLLGPAPGPLAERSRGGTTACACEIDSQTEVSLAHVGPKSRCPPQFLPGDITVPIHDDMDQDDSCSWDPRMRRGRAGGTNSRLSNPPGHPELAPCQLPTPCFLLLQANRSSTT